MTSDAEMQYLIEVWTRTETEMPSLKQLSYLMFLLETRQGADANQVWSRDVLTRRDVGSIIHKLLKLPERRC